VATKREREAGASLPNNPETGCWRDEHHHSLTGNGNRIRLADQVVIGSESGRLEYLVAQAARPDRLNALCAALSIVAAGEYLPGVESPWIEHRPEQLAVLCLDARCEAAEPAFAMGDFQSANTLADEVFVADAL
jgi:hypothetical protein